MDSNNLTLGLDLGVTSIGWALADVEGQQIVDAGVRIFEAPMDVAKFEAGEPGGSKAAIRRKSRMQRRQTSRRQARHRDLYTRFRKGLLKDGFMMLQYSIYARYLPSEEAADSHRTTIRAIIPPLGQVRLMTVTDHQFGKMEVFYGRKPREPEPVPDQILLF